LLSKDGTIGRVVHYKEDLGVVLLSSVAILRPLEAIEPEFLAQSLRSFIFDRQLFGLQSGSALKRLILSDIKKIRVPVPGIPTQQKIARILQTVDRAMEKTEALIEKYQQIKAGLMHDLFTRGLWTQEELDRGDHKGTAAVASAKAGQLRPTRQDAPHLYQQTPIGWFPKAWEVKKLVDMSPRIGDGIHTTPKYSEHGAYFFINGNNLSEGRIVVTKGTLQVDESEFKKYYIPLNRNTVLYSINGTIGNMAYYCDEPVILGKSAAYIKLDDATNAEFVFWSLQTDRPKRFFRRELTGSTIQNLSLSAIRSLPLAQPVQPAEKAAINARIASVTRLLSSEETRLNKLQKQKSGLMHDLLTGKVPVTP